MSVASEITRINTNIANAYTKAFGKGAPAPTKQNSENLASCIESITGGGGGTTYAPIRISFQDYMFSLNDDSSAYEMTNEVQNIDTSKVKNLFYSFSNIQGVEKLDLSSWNTSSCEDFSHMFENSSFKYIDASNFTFEEAGTLVYMFENCYNLETLVLGAGWLDIYDWQLQEDMGGLPGDMGAEIPLLDNTNIQNIYVPDDLVGDFQGSYAFNMYADYIKPISEMPN